MINYLLNEIILMTDVAQLVQVTLCNKNWSFFFRTIALAIAISYKLRNVDVLLTRCAIVNLSGTSFEKNKIIHFYVKTLLLQMYLLLRMIKSTKYVRKR